MLLTPWRKSENEICVGNVILWNNKHILIDDKSLYWKEWHKANILRIKDLDENNGFLTLNKFLLKIGLKAPFTIKGIWFNISYTL